MHRYKLILEYDGTPFVGWQMQENGPSVQGALARAIETFSGEAWCRAGQGAPMPAFMRSAKPRIWTSSRTGSPTRSVTRSTRSSGPILSACLHASERADDFDARFSAVARHYLYRIIDRRAPLALERNAGLGRVPCRSTPRRCTQAAQALIGNHDFTTFRSTECQAKSPMKTLDRLDVSRHGEIIRVETSARSFLHNQVRSMVGSLKLVGEGRWRADELRAALEARDRSACGAVAPPQGLYLVKVDY